MCTYETTNQYLALKQAQWIMHHRDSTARRTVECLPAGIQGCGGAVVPARLLPLRPLQRLRLLLVPELLQTHRGRGDVRAKHRRLHRVATAHIQYTCTTVNRSEIDATVQGYDISYLNMIWSPTLYVRVTLMPGPLCCAPAPAPAPIMTDRQVLQLVGKVPTAVALTVVVQKHSSASTVPVSFHAAVHACVSRAHIRFWLPLLRLVVSQHGHLLQVQVQTQSKHT